jgi:uncharacterized protein YdaU (DUF1376 family)
MPMPKRTTAPAFQFYPKDFLTSPKVRRMTMTERGVYITLLSLCWIDGSLSTNLDELSHECRLSPKQFTKLWNASVVRECFVERDGRLHNERLLQEKRKQIEYRRRQSDAAALRWDKQRIANAVASADARHEDGNGFLSSSSSSSSSASSKKEEKKNAAQPRPTDTVLTFTTNGQPAEWYLTQSQIETWTTVYAGVDVLTECRKALEWTVHNSRKTARGMPAFLLRWLGNASNRSGRVVALQPTGTDGRGRTGRPEARKYAGLEITDDK